MIGRDMGWGTPKHTSQAEIFSLAIPTWPEPEHENPGPYPQPLIDHLRFLARSGFAPISFGKDENTNDFYIFDFVLLSQAEAQSAVEEFLERI